MSAAARFAGQEPGRRKGLILTKKASLDERIAAASPKGRATRGIEAIVMPWTRPRLLSVLRAAVRARRGLRAAPPRARADAAAGPRVLPGARLILTHPDEYVGYARIGTYVSSTWGFSTSSYWIEGPTGLILIVPERS